MEAAMERGKATRRPEESRRREPLVSPAEVARDYGIPETTHAVWRSTDRYGFRRLVLKVGRSVRYRREELEAWLESRRQDKQDEAA